MRMPEDPRDPRSRRRTELSFVAVLVFGVCILPLVASAAFGRLDLFDPLLYGMVAGVVAIATALLFIGASVPLVVALRRHERCEAVYTGNLIEWIQAADDATLRDLPPELPPSPHTSRLAQIEIERRERERSA